MEEFDFQSKYGNFQNQSFPSKDLYYEFANLVYKLRSQVCRITDGSPKQDDVDKLKRLLATSAQRNIIDLFVQLTVAEKECFCDKFNRQILSTPMLCRVLQQMILFQRVKSNPSMPSHKKNELKPNQIDTELLESKSGRDHTAYFGRQEISGFLFELAEKVFEIANIHKIRVVINEVADIEKLLQRYFNMWRTYDLEAMDAFISESPKWKIHGTDRITAFKIFIQDFTH